MAYYRSMQVRSTNLEVRNKFKSAGWRTNSKSLNHLNFRFSNLFRISDFGFRASSPRGFTLIELLVVIAIIGILVSIGVYSWSSVSARGRDTTRKSDLTRIKQVLQQYYSDTRTYPVFDTSKHGTLNEPIYSATWQLTQGGSTDCSRRNDATKIAPKYIDKIPTDPKDTAKYQTMSCANLAENQGNRYLYISAPTDTTSGPTQPATSFGLMATLEQGASDRITDPKLNPLDRQYNCTTFGTWYSSKNNYGNTIGVNANYLIDSKNQ